MNEKQISECYTKILSRIEKPVRFKYPTGKKLQGTLKDRVVMHTRSITQMKDFFDVIDYIEFDVNGKKKEAFRFGYYIYENGKLRWGSQTTLTEEKSILLNLFLKALKEEKIWWKELIEKCREQL